MKLLDNDWKGLFCPMWMISSQTDLLNTGSRGVCVCVCDSKLSTPKKGCWPVIHSYWSCNSLHIWPCVSWLSTFIRIQLISVCIHTYIYYPTIPYLIHLTTHEQYSNPKMWSFYTGWSRPDFPQRIVLIPNAMIGIIRVITNQHSVSKPFEHCSNDNPRNMPMAST